MNCRPWTASTKHSLLKFMHKFKHNKLPFSFSETWITNKARNPDIILRNADNYYVPAHNLATIKWFPLFSFPKTLNEDVNNKFNPSLKLYLKSWKLPIWMLLFKLYCHHPPPPTPFSYKFYLLFIIISSFDCKHCEPVITVVVRNYGAILSIKEIAECNLYYSKSGNSFCHLRVK